MVGIDAGSSHTTITNVAWQLMHSHMRKHAVRILAVLELMNVVCGGCHMYSIQFTVVTLNKLFCCFSCVSQLRLSLQEIYEQLGILH